MCESRFETMFKNYRCLESYLRNWKKKIVLVVTHADHSVDRKKDFAEICKIFRDVCPRMIFCSNKSCPQNLSDVFYAFMSNMRRELVDFNEIEHEIKLKSAKYRTLPCL